MKCVQRLWARSAIAAALSVGVFLPQTVAACSGDSEYIGSVCYMAIRYCPENYLLADGRILSVSNYPALYSLIGNLYGGSAPNTFALPDLRGRTAIGTGVLGSTAYTLAKAVGQETVVGNGSGSVLLAAAQIPPHTHPASVTLSGTSTTVSLPLSGTITNLPFSAVASLGVTGITKIGSSSTTSRSATLTDKALLASVGGPAALLYAPAGAANDRQLGPDGSVTGTAAGTVSGMANGGQLSGSASGAVSLALTGTVSVGPNVAAPAPVTIPVSVSVAVRNPSLPLTACIAVIGLYPVNPN